MVLGLLAEGCQSDPSHTREIHSADYTQEPPVIDGRSRDRCWEKATAYPIDQLWSGKLPHASDYMGRFRITWDSSNLYLLAEVFDDSLFQKPGPRDSLPHHEDFFEVILSLPSPSEKPVARFYIMPYGSIWGNPGDPALAWSRQGAAAVRTEKKLSTWEWKLGKGWLVAAGMGEDVEPAWPRPVHFAVVYHDTDKSGKTESRMGSMELIPGPESIGGHVDAAALDTLILGPSHNP